jgi:ATP-binding cassette subfamily C exporter for protease/lipase
MHALLKVHRSNLWWSFSLGFVASLLVLAPSLYMLEVYDRVVPSRSYRTLLMLTLAVMLAYAVMELLEYLRNEILREIGHTMDERLSPRLFALMFAANLRKHPGGTIQPLNDWRQVREFIYSPFVLAVMEAPVAILYLAIVSTINPLLGWFTLVAAGVQLGIAWLTERRTQQPLTAANHSAIAAQKYAEGALHNAEVIQAMGMQNDIHTRWLTLQRRFLGQQSEASLAAGSLQAASKMVQQVLGSALLGLGAWLTLKNELNGGGAMMVVASIIGARVLAPLVQMVSNWRQAVSARDAWIRLDHLLSATPPEKPTMPLPAPRGVLTVDQLAGGAPPAPGRTAAPILRGIQFSLQPGELLAVIGPSAAGKTTLGRLLLGLWPAITGKVRLDGVDMHLWNKTELGPHLGYLPQSVELFEGSVAENIGRFGVQDRAAVEEAAAAVGLHEFILGLPQGYETPVGRDGAILSGGQRQRVALARALFGRPTLIVLDEPNASLDDSGDAALAVALQALKARGATVVVMTHRSGILSVADKILLLNDGAQRAFGPRDEVLAALQKSSQRKSAATA